MKIVISHGSGGIGSAELRTRDFFIEAGYEVELLDFFTPHNIDHLRWSIKSREKDPNITFKEMFDVDFPEGPLVHIGFSIGGFLGLCHSDKFVKNYLFYPGVQGFTQEMLERNYSNTTVILGSEDSGKYKYNNFHTKAKHAPNTATLVGAHHAFMMTDIDRSINMVTYGGNYGDLMTDKEFNDLSPNYKVTSSTYGVIGDRVAHLKYHSEFSASYLNIIKEQLDHDFPNIRKRKKLHEGSVRCCGT